MIEIHDNSVLPYVFEELALMFGKNSFVYVLIKLIILHQSLPNYLWRVESQFTEEEIRNYLDRGKISSI